MAAATGRRRRGGRWRIHARREARHARRKRPLLLSALASFPSPFDMIGSQLPWRNEPLTTERSNRLVRKVTRAAPLLISFSFALCSFAPKKLVSHRLHFPVLSPLSSPSSSLSSPPSLPGLVFPCSAPPILYKTDAAQECKYSCFHLFHLLCLILGRRELRNGEGAEVERSPRGQS